MRPIVKVGVVIGGYIVAVLVASVAVVVRLAGTTGPDAQASSGMYAFGDAALLVGVFGMVALAPTGASLFFLRPYPRFWNILSVLGIATALTGIAAAVLFAVGRYAPPSTHESWAPFSVLRMFSAPLLALGFAMCAVISSHRRARLALLVATVMEMAVSIFAFCIWLVPLVLQR